MTKAKEGRVCDGSLEPSSQGEGEGTGGEGASSPSDAVRGIAARRRRRETRHMPTWMMENGIGSMAVVRVSQHRRSIHRSRWQGSMLVT